MQIVVKPLVIQKLNELFFALLEEDYFSDIDNAELYRSHLEQFILSLPVHKHRRSKDSRWGEYYAAYKANRHTTWYITFDKYEDDGYIVLNIFNNHTSEYPLFIAG